MDDTTIAKLEIAELVNSWALFRDQGKWDQLRDVFHPDGTIRISWIDASHDKFIEASKLASASGRMQVKHHLGVPHVTVARARALSEVDVRILVRGTLEGVTFDTTSYARFWDRLERREGRFRILERVAIYEKDRMDPVGQAALPAALTCDLDAFPPALRFLASTFRPLGVSLVPGVISDGSAAMTRVYQDAKAWLRGATDAGSSDSAELQARERTPQ